MDDYTRCTCASDGNAYRCPHHTQRDFEMANNVMKRGVVIHFQDRQFAVGYVDLSTDTFELEDGASWPVSIVFENPSVSSINFTTR